MSLTHVWYQCMTSGPWQTAMSGKKRGEWHRTAPPNKPPPPHSAPAIICAPCFFSLHPNVFWPSQLFIYLFICLSCFFLAVSILHHLLLCFPLYCFFLSLRLSFSPSTSLLSPSSFMSRWWLSRIETGHLRSLQWHWGAKLPWTCVCVTHCHHPRHNRGHTEFMFPRCQSRSDPGDFLIINSNLNLTSNADPRDNIVVTISTRKDRLQVL